MLMRITPASKRARRIFVIPRVPEKPTKYSCQGFKGIFLKGRTVRKEISNIIANNVIKCESKCHSMAIVKG
jgi:hypothetical protein